MERTARRSLPVKIRTRKGKITIAMMGKSVISTFVLSVSARKHSACDLIADYKHLNRPLLKSTVGALGTSCVIEIWAVFDC